MVYPTQNGGPFRLAECTVFAYQPPPTRFQNERRLADSRGFIDGDLIEAFLELKREKAEEV